MSTAKTFHEQLIEKIGRRNFERLQSIRVGIAGAGGLGSNCAAHLVRAGFRNLKLVDFDVVEAGNLDRQFYFADQVGQYKVEALRRNLLRITPDLDLEIEVQKIEKDSVNTLFSQCAVVAECLDRAEDKSMLVSELLPRKKFVVAVSGLGGYGSSDAIRVHPVRENLVLVGDLQSDIALRPALAPRVAIVAAKQADVILEHVLSQSTT
ncbi:sulfur carrier protein ThiS adenylyltransferase [Syntrophus gentianae]|uniref:Sulfur carrier protein ThiS adenylyltransferase n=1 Tax=Syntrophus gentianae TaxID=43775 RepID=A0A1H7YAU4_9BACT|nr:sulfur carrier protein ThiS adenylyltransferase ThiF [Syntrophus gentianae]SEM43356.1 sulfur carrier protein ThiS adenylyltransferase [Syntrophus gentianae]